MHFFDLKDVIILFFFSFLHWHINLIHELQFTLKRQFIFSRDKSFVIISIRCCMHSNNFPIAKMSNTLRKIVLKRCKIIQFCYACSSINCQMKNGISHSWTSWRGSKVNILSYFKWFNSCKRRVTRFFGCFFFFFSVMSHQIQAQ